MPGPHGPWGAALLAAVRDGRVPSGIAEFTRYCAGANGSSPQWRVIRTRRMGLARVGRADGIPTVPRPSWQSCGSCSGTGTPNYGRDASVVPDRAVDLV